jgi:hypothetical protein
MVMDVTHYAILKQVLLAVEDGIIGVIRVMKYAEMEEILDIIYVMMETTLMEMAVVRNVLLNRDGNVLEEQNTHQMYAESYVEMVLT